MFRRFNEKPSVNTSATVELRKTALNSVHRRLGAKMVNFGGWDMPVEYSGVIAEHTAVRGSGRVGRTQAGKALEQDALTAAVVAAVRHKHTNYDALLAKGLDRTRAREQVGEKIDSILAAWRKSKPQIRSTSA